MDIYERENLLEDERNSNYQVVGTNTPRRYWIGLIVILLSNISLSIVSVSIWPYIVLNKQSIYTLAVSISAFHTGSTIGRKFFSYYMDRTKSYWLLLGTSLLVTLIGDIMYAYYPKQMSIIGSRFIVGFGTGSQVVLQNLLSESSDSLLQKYRVSKVTLFTSIAYIIGPAIVAGISTVSLDHQLNYFSDNINGISLLGWIAAIFTFISIVITLIGKLLDNSIVRHYENDLISSIENEFTPKVSIPYRAQQSCIFSPKVTIFLLCVVHFLIFNAGMILETLFIPFMININGGSSYGWSITKIALFFIGLGVSCAVSSGLSKKISNNNILLIGSLLFLVVGYAFMVEWSFPTTIYGVVNPPLFKFLLGVVFVAIGFPIAVSSSISMFLDIFSNMNKFSTISFQLSSNLGRLLGPIWAALIYDNQDANFAFFFVYKMQDNNISQSVECLQWKHDALKLSLESNVFKFGEERLAMIYNLDEFRKIAKDANDHLGGIQTMAIKSNPVMPLLKEAIKSGLGAEVASFGELKIAELAGFPVEKIIYDSPIKTESELKYALNLGVVVNIDNFQELERIENILKDYTQEKLDKLVVGIRINPQVEPGALKDLSTGVPTSKFGIGLEYAEKIFAAYKTNKWLKCVHLHVGSQGFEMSSITDGISKVMDFVKEVNKATEKQIKYFNIGGGLSVNFNTEESKPTVIDYADHLRKTVPELFNGDFKLITEFGRAYWAKCGVTVSGIEYTKKSGGRDIAITHLGGNLFIRTIYQYPLWKLRVTIFDSNGQYKSGKDGKVNLTDLGGPLCFAADVLVKEALLPELTPEDYVMVHDTGAYFYSSYSHYNLRLAPPIYSYQLVDGKPALSLIKRSETIEEKIQFFS
eukprot:gene8263-10153_t